jgi:hypothetical protein
MRPLSLRRRMEADTAAHAGLANKPDGSNGD